MRNLLITTIFLSAAMTANLVAQSPPKCPQVEIIAPKNAVEPSEIGVFTLDIKPVDPQWKLTYKWTSSDEIREGQGTRQIKVLFSNPGSNLVATVEIIGLPANCTQFLTVAAPICDCVDPILLDQFTGALKSEFLSENQEYIKNNPNVKIHVFLPGSENDHSVETRDTLSILRSIFKERGTFVFTDKKDYPVTIYAVPPGASNPQP